jgi:hypothetical protein
VVVDWFEGPVILGTPHNQWSLGVRLGEDVECRFEQLVRPLLGFDDLLDSVSVPQRRGGRLRQLSEPLDQFCDELVRLLLRGSEPLIAVRSVSPGRGT